MSENLRGSVLMIASMAAFVFNDTAVKLLGERLPLFEVMFLRGILTVCFVGGLCQYFNAWKFSLSAKDWTFVVIRSLCDICASYLFLTALFHMPLANLTAILQFLPLIIAVGAALFFNEKMGWRRVSAIVIGFLGMGLILRPGTEGFGLYSYFGVGAVLCVAVRDLITRRISRHVPSLLVTFFNTIGILLYSSIALLWTDWVPVTVGEVKLIFLAAGLVSLAYWLSVLVMRSGDISFVAPFRYTGLLWALLIGYLVFDHFPDGYTLLGAAVIIFSGLYMMWRENRLNRQIKPL